MWPSSWIKSHKIKNVLKKNKRKKLLPFKIASIFHVSVRSCVIHQRPPAKTLQIPQSSIHLFMSYKSLHKIDVKSYIANISVHLDISRVIYGYDAARSSKSSCCRRVPFSSSLASSSVSSSEEQCFVYSKHSLFSFLKPFPSFFFFFINQAHINLKHACHFSINRSYFCYTP